MITPDVLIINVTLKINRYIFYLIMIKINNLILLVKKMIPKLFHKTSSYKVLFVYIKVIYSDRNFFNFVKNQYKYVKIIVWG